MNIIAESISRYCEAFTKPQTEVLAELERETHLRTLYPQMLCGHLQGKFLGMVSAMIKPQAVLEIGTFTGYSAICLASGLAEGGMVHTIEEDNELEEIIKKFFQKAGLNRKIKLYMGRAEDIVPQLDMTFDIVFIDANKKDYPAYYTMVFNKVKRGGYIIADNALWSGKVLERKKDTETTGIHEFNAMVRWDKRVDNILLPLRDGLMIIRKLV